MHTMKNNVHDIECIEGAIKFGNTLAIPGIAEKPKYERIKSKKYIKNDK